MSQPYGRHVDMMFPPHRRHRTLKSGKLREGNCQRPRDPACGVPTLAELGPRAERADGMAYSSGENPPEVIARIGARGQGTATCRSERLAAGLESTRAVGSRGSIAHPHGSRRWAEVVKSANIKPWATSKRAKRLGPTCNSGTTSRRFLISMNRSLDFTSIQARPTPMPFDRCLKHQALQPFADRAQRQPT